MFKCTDPLNLPRGITFWLDEILNFKMSTGGNAPLRFGLCGRTGQRASRRTHGDVLFCTCLVFWCWFSLCSHFVCFFFVRAELFDLFAMIESEFCFAFLFLFLFFCIVLVYVFCSISCGDKFIYVTCFCFSLYDVLHKRTVLVCAMRVNVCVCVCVCVCGAGQSSQHNTKNNFTCARTGGESIYFCCVCVCVRVCVWDRASVRT